MRHMKPVAAAGLAVGLALAACATPAGGGATGAGDGSFTVTGSDRVKLVATPLETFDAPWAMTFLPDGRAVVTEKAGALWLLDTGGTKLGEISGGPEVKPWGQGGLGDIILHPDFAETGGVYLSYAARDPANLEPSHAVVESATLSLTMDGGALSGRKIIWEQTPDHTGSGHYGHRMVVSPDGYLFITSGDRQLFTPAQDMTSNMGKVVRLNLDGSLPSDNPFADQGGVAAQVWTLGHRNPLGIAFDGEGRLWAQEMGPAHGDELNLIVRGENYGYPEVSNGDHYDGRRIPDHDTRPEFAAPAAYWVPAISPAGLIVFDGSAFPGWAGDAFIGGLSSQALIRVELDAAGGSAEEGGRYGWDKRIREVEQGPDGALYVLEDGSGGRLIRLTPAAD